MSSSFNVVEVKLSADVADAATFTAGYAAGRGPGDYQGGSDHAIVSNAYGNLTVNAGDVSFSFGAANVTITNNTGGVLASGTTFFVHMDRFGDDDPSEAVANTDKMANSHVVTVNLGAPDVADANGFVASQNLTSAGVFSTDVTATAALAAAALAGVADKPRNVVAAWTTTAVLTVTGTDEYGNTIVESSASGTTMTGKKAFKTITDITVSTNITALTVGTGDVLGLPMFLGQLGEVLAELEDGAAATAGTVVAGVAGAATATTGDVRGTYDPNSAADGAAAFQLVCALGRPDYRGSAQFAG